jgi:CRP-like cAMP-binding protein
VLAAKLLVAGPTIKLYRPRGRLSFRELIQITKRVFVAALWLASRHVPVGADYRANVEGRLDGRSRENAAQRSRRPNRMAKMTIAMSPLRSGAAAPLTQKLGQSLSLAPSEVMSLRELQSGSRPFRRGQEIISEGKAHRTLFIVMEGVAFRYRILRDGRRHVLNVVLPGDIAGVPGCLFESALYSVKAVTDLWASPVPLTRLMDLFHTQPQLVAKLFWSFTWETAMYAEHLIAIGRRTALERVGHFLLELLSRLQAVGLADNDSFSLPLTQALIADALGLSVPYVNQVLRSLREDGLIQITDKVMVIKDIEALSALVDFERNYLKPLSIVDILNEAA